MDLYDPDQNHDTQIRLQHNKADYAILKILTPPAMLLKQTEAKGGEKFSTIAQSLSLSLLGGVSPVLSDSSSGRQPSMYHSSRRRQRSNCIRSERRECFLPRHAINLSPRRFASSWRYVPLGERRSQFGELPVDALGVVDIERLQRGSFSLSRQRTTPERHGLVRAVLSSLDEGTILRFRSRKSHHTQR